MSRDHHCEHVVKGTPNVSPTPAEEGQTEAAACDANCDAIATRIATPQASAPDSTESHETTEPAATTRITAGSSEVTPFIKTGRGTTPRKKQPALATEGSAGVKKSARRGHGWPGGREEVAGAGREQPASRTGKLGGAVSCDAKCDAISPDCVELLARAVILVAGMAIPEAARQAVLARVIANLSTDAEVTSGALKESRCRTLVVQAHASARPTSKYARHTRE